MAEIKKTSEGIEFISSEDEEFKEDMDQYERREIEALIAEYYIGFFKGEYEINGVRVREPGGAEDGETAESIRFENRSWGHFKITVTDPAAAVFEFGSKKYNLREKYYELGRRKPFGLHLWNHGKNPEAPVVILDPMGARGWDIPERPAFHILEVIIDFVIDEYFGEKAWEGE